MKKVIALVALLSLAPMANASLSVYEPFNYTSGAFANNTAATGTGLTGNWTCGAAGTIGTGLTYPGLTVANNALSSGGSRQYVSLATPLSSGTKYISFLYKASGNMGGNIDGVYFPNGNATCLWFGFGLGPFSGSQGQLGLASMTTAGTGALGVTSSLKQIGLGTYGNTYLVVLKIDFDTSGANDTVTVYTNPVANASAPGIAAAGILTTYDVGTISKVGLNVQGGATISVDEIRVGDTYGDVVGYVPPPAAPTGLTATAGVNAVGLSWNATSGATGYKVLRGTASGVYTVTNAVASNTNYDITVVGGTTYFYVVQATNAAGAGASSAEVSVTPTIALPSAPTGLTATGTNGAVFLNWSSGAGAASYNVKRSTTSGAEVTIANTAATSYTDTGVVNGTTYFYKVSATNNAGESATTSEASATPNLPPAAPTGLSATAGTNQVALSWTASAGALSYNIKRSTTSGSGYSTIATTTSPTVSYTDTTAIKFTQYFYVVSAVNGNGEGANSSPEATATALGAYGPNAYEPFNYAVGNLANNTPSTGTGFTGNWTVSASPSIVAGLTYSNLPTTANAYQHAAAGAQTTENLTTSLSSGSKYISFLFKGSGNSGGDSVGVFFKGSNASSLFAGFRVPDAAATTGFGLGTVNSTTLGGASALGSAVNINNTSVHLIVLKIDFNTSGANDTVSLWIDPPAAVITPGVAANVVNGTFDVGTISAFGINITGGYNPVIDEVRVGDLYADVVGYGAAATPTVPTSVAISVAQGEQVRWTAASTNSYQPQKSADNSTWTNFGGFFTGNALSSVYETNPAAFYRVLEYLPGAPGPNVMLNGSFETAANNNIGATNWSGPASSGTANQYVTNQYDVLTPTDGTSMLFMEGTNGTGSLVFSDLIPISGGLTYKVVFDVANPVKLNGANPQFQIEFFDSGNGFISNTGFGSLQSVGAGWTTISNNYAAPANAASLHIQFLEAVGGGAHWVTLVDNVRVSALALLGSTNVLSPTLQLGGTFTATVISNGVATATQASGTITFLTNNAALSTNTLALGTTTSATALVNPPYTLKAVYSGDATYLASSNTLTVTNVAMVITNQPAGQSVSRGQTASFTVGATGIPAPTYQWLFNGSLVGGARGTTLTITNAARTNGGNYSVILTNISGSVTSSVAALTYLNTAPVATNLSVTRTAGLNLLVSLTILATKWSDADGDAVTLSGINLVTTNSVNLATNGSWILYTNSPNVNDQLSYSISDGFGGTNIGFINIVVTSSVTGTNSIVGITTGSTNVVTAYGIPGYPYILERATNLAPAVWVTVATNAAATNGIISAQDAFNDLGGTQPSSAYYRLKWQP